MCQLHVACLIFPQCYFVPYLQSGKPKHLLTPTNMHTISEPSFHPCIRYDRPMLRQLHSRQLVSDHASLQVFSALFITAPKQLTKKTNARWLTSSTPLCLHLYT